MLLLLLLLLLLLRLGLSFLGPPLSQTAAARAKKGAPTRAKQVSKKFNIFLGRGTDRVVASTIGDHASFAA